MAEFKESAPCASNGTTSHSHIRKEKELNVSLQKKQSSQQQLIPSTSSSKSSSSPILPNIVENVSENTQKLRNEREHIYELFQPWALKTYGDQAKTKTITLLKKARILKALEGKEHSRPDSSKFRFWVKSKSFTTRRPEEFEEISGIQKQTRSLPSNAVLSDNPSEVDLFVMSTTKDFGKRIYRKVAVVEEFFDIIYNVHMELGGRSGMHAGQKRTYRIITETYAFLPREAVTRFLSICPECKKNLRPSTPPSAAQTEEPINDSSSEIEAFNSSSQTESSIEAVSTTKDSHKLQYSSTISATSTRSTTSSPFLLSGTTKRSRQSESQNKIASLAVQSDNLVEQSNIIVPELPAALFNRFKESYPTGVPISQLSVDIPPSTSTSKIRINPLLQKSMTPPITKTHEQLTSSPFYYHPPSVEMSTPKSHENFFRYYEFMRRFYTGEYSITEPHQQNVQQSLKGQPVLTTPLSSKEPLDQPKLAQIMSSHLTTLKKSYSDSDDDNDFEVVPVSKKFKKSVESFKYPKYHLQESSKHKQTELSNIYPITASIQKNLQSPTNQIFFRSSGSDGDQQSTSAGFVPINNREATLPDVSNKKEGKATEKMDTESSMSPKLLSGLQNPESRPTAPSFSTLLPPLDLTSLKPITATYLQLTRSMGLKDEDALRFDNLETIPPNTTDTTTSGESNSESDPYAGLMKDADKLKLMLLAWNYQNSNAVRNGTEGPDLGVVGGLWAQYQNALAQTAASSVKMDTSLSPVPRVDVNSPMEAQDETNSSGQKEEDEVSEDDSDDKLDEKLATHDPERLKAFNMFVRLFVDENLDRIIPISKQPKEKIQAIIDSCARQFPEFSDRSRKRIRTYLKSCRRNKKTRDGWDNTTRPTPAHLTSVQAEQILAIACENESMNAKRMRIGLDPITHAIPAPGSAVAAAAAAAAAAVAVAASGNAANAGVGVSSSGGSSSTITSIADCNTGTISAVLPSVIPSNASSGMSSARGSPLTLNASGSINTPGLDIKPSPNTLSNGNSVAPNGTTMATSLAGLPASSPLYRPADFSSPSGTSPFVAAAAAVAGRTSNYPTYFPNVGNLATPTDLSMKPSLVSSASTITSPAVNANNSNCANSTVTSTISGLSGAAVVGSSCNTNTLSATQQLQQLQQQQQLHQQHSTTSSLTATSLTGTLDPNTARAPPLLAHKLTPNEVAAARQVISAYRESAAFLLRTADQVEQLLVQQQ